MDLSCLSGNGLADAAREHGLLLVYLFGSQATGHAGPLSDVDLAVLPSDRRAWAREAREAALDGFATWVATRVGVDRDRIDIHDLASMPTTATFEVISTGNCRYEGEPRLRECFEAQAMSMQQDFQPIQDHFRAQLHQRLAEGRFGR